MMFPYNAHKSLKAHFLISNKTQKDSYFSDSVILVMEHNEVASFGLILNRPNSKKEVLHQLTHSENHEKIRNIPLYEGGPVRGKSIFIIHNNSFLKSPGKKILPGVFWSSSVDLWEELLTKEMHFNTYQGYAGWAPRQLEQEIENKSWIVLPASDEIIFTEEPNLAWSKALNMHGGLYSYFANNVRDPMLN